MHLGFEVELGGVKKGLHTCGGGGGNVVFAVVDEEDVWGWGREAGCGVGVDDGFGLGEVECVGPSLMVEAGEPGAGGDDAAHHLVSDVGEDSGSDSGALEGEGPVDHGLVGAGPEGGVCGDELVDCGLGRGVAGYFAPVGSSGEVASVVGMAGSPVGGVECGLVVSGEGLHGLPCGGVGAGREDHAVVEEDCVDRFDWSHAMG